MGEYSPGLASWIASMADSARVTSWTGLRKKNSLAAPTPCVLWPKGISLRYISRISCFVYLRSIWIAHHSSTSLRRMEMSDLSAYSRPASCWVIVLAPETYCPVTILKTARSRPRTLKPWWE